ncbi:MAG: DUF420 domain-containing protein [Deltaproteobacteria bacterium]|nr:DUF420 domain-containing protein [Deltaproteobacteria bacterium]
MSVAAFLPTLNAALNATSALFIVAGVLSIRDGRRERHRRFMLAAVATSALFLVSYLTRSFLTGVHRFPGAGVVKAIYLVVLSSHMLLAVVVVPLVLVALGLALKERFATHRKVVRFAYPVWLYVSVTGVVVYFMLYHLNPGGAG